MSYEDESKIVPCYEVPKDFVAKNPCDLPCEGPIPPTIRKTGVERVIGRKVLDACCHLGSYGMGGPGFLGVKLEKNSEHSDEWLVLCLWGSDEWVRYDGLPIFSIVKTYEQYGQKKFIENVTGKVLKSFDITDKSCKIMLDETVMEITEDPKSRPTYGGSGGYRTLLETDSLLDAWVVSSTMYIAI
jgi:hypothetical protein